MQYEMIFRILTKGEPLRVARLDYVIEMSGKERRRNAKVTA